MGGVLGWRPTEVYKSTIPEIFHAMNGWKRSQGIDPDTPRGGPTMTTADLEAAERRIAEIYERNKQHGTQDS